MNGSHQRSISGSFAGWLAAFFVVSGLVVSGLDVAHAQVLPSPDEAAVQAHLGIFLTRPDRRDANERVQRSADRLEIWFQRTVQPRARTQILCAGFKWLLAGRLANSAGIQGLFAALPDVNEVVLVFYEVETRVEPQPDGRYRQLRSAGPRARYAITRQRAAQLDPAAIPAALGGDCLAAGEGMIEVFWAR